MVLDSWNVHTSPLIGTVRTGLSEAGLDFGVFGFSKDASLPTTPMPADVKRKTRFANGNGSGSGAENNTDADENSGEEEEEVERESRPVIKLRSKRIGRNLSRSRSRRDLTQAAEDQHRPHTPDPAEETVANVRFSAHTIAKSDITAIMPFALIAPEAKKRRHQQLLAKDEHDMRDAAFGGHPGAERMTSDIVAAEEVDPPCRDGELRKASSGCVGGAPEPVGPGDAAQNRLAVRRPEDVAVDRNLSREVPHRDVEPIASEAIGERRRIVALSDVIAQSHVSALSSTRPYPGEACAFANRIVSSTVPAHYIAKFCTCLPHRCGPRSDSICFSIQTLGTGSISFV